MHDHVSVRVPETRMAVRAAVTDDLTSSRARFLRGAIVAGGQARVPATSAARRATSVGFVPTRTPCASRASFFA